MEYLWEITYILYRPQDEGAKGVQLRSRGV